MSLSSGTLPPGGAPVAVVGASATGKTALALELAQRLGGCELISADAMAVYRGLDLGTAKPSPEERRRATWHLIDVVEPEEEFSVARFQTAAREAVASIEARGHRAVVVGGTGLYVRSLTDELTLPGRYPSVAAELEALAARPRGEDELRERLEALDPVAARRVAPGNRRRLVRALEVTIGSGRPFSSYGPGLERYPSTRYLLVGLRLGRRVLDERLARRLDAQLAAGLLDEVRALAARSGGLSRTAAEAVGYRELLAHVAGVCSLEDARAVALARLRRLARRQEAWFRRDPRIVWFDAQDPRLADRVAALVAREAPRVAAALVSGGRP